MMNSCHNDNDDDDDDEKDGDDGNDGGDDDGDDDGDGDDDNDDDGDGDYGNDVGDDGAEKTASEHLIRSVPGPCTHSTYNKNGNTKCTRTQIKIQNILEQKYKYSYVEKIYDGEKLSKQ